MAIKVSDTSLYLETEALEGRERTLTIAKVRQPKNTEKGRDGRPLNSSALILTYEKATKEHICCRTVQKQIRQLHGNDTAGWIGKQITIYPTTCKAFGDDNTPCIRVKV